jgi:FixJ family two-component response regulator
MVCIVRRSGRALLPCNGFTQSTRTSLPAIPLVREIWVLKRPLVAVVDDDESIRDTTKDLLESAGLAAVTFASASLFLKSRRLKTISCLIADMRMPEMTGLELHQHLVASNSAIPTILMTAYPDDRVLAQAIKGNVVCYLAKPFAADELLGCIRCAIQSRRGSAD